MQCWQVADNGRGVQPKDYEALALKYHTSKLSQFNDLEVSSSMQASSEQQRCIRQPMALQRQ